MIGIPPGDGATGPGDEVDAPSELVFTKAIIIACHAIHRDDPGGPGGIGLPSTSTWRMVSIQDEDAGELAMMPPAVDLVELESTATRSSTPRSP
jgi:hypothetical protein